MKIREMHDREGYTEVEILSQEEIETIVENWLKTHNFSYVFPENSLMIADSQNTIHTACVDVRNGEIVYREDIPGTSNADDTFFITLARCTGIERCDTLDCEEHWCEDGYCDMYIHDCIENFDQYAEKNWKEHVSDFYFNKE